MNRNSSSNQLPKRWRRPQKSYARKSKSFTDSSGRSQSGFVIPEAFDMLDWLPTDSAPLLVLTEADNVVSSGLRIRSIPMTSQLKSGDFLRQWLRLKKESLQRMELERKIIRKRVLRWKEVLRSSWKLKDAPRLSLDSSGSACSGDLPMLRRSPYAAHRSTRQQQQPSHNQQQQLQQHALTSQQSQSSNPHLPRLRTEIPH